MLSVCSSYVLLVAVQHILDSNISWIQLIELLIVGYCYINKIVGRQYYYTCEKGSSATG